MVKSRRIRLLMAALLLAASQGVVGVARQSAPQTDTLEEARRLCKEVVVLYRDGRYAEAVPLAERALAIFEKRLGPDHPEVVTGLANLAQVYGAQGAYAKAEPLLIRALAINEKTLGPDDARVALSLNNLAVLYQDQGAYAKAEPLLVRALAINEKALGPDDPSVAMNLNNLAVLYQNQGAYAKAEPLFVRALGINEREFGPDHPNVATDLNNLALLYKDQGAYAKAEPYLVRALRINESALEPGHPDIAMSLNNLALVYQAQGAYSRADPLFVRALQIYEKALGPDHPHVALNLNNLASNYQAQGLYSRAEPLYLRVVAIVEKALQPDHPQVALSLGNLAELYRAQGAYAKAEEVLMRALRIRERALGPDHPDVASSLNNIADLYRAQGAYERAEPLFVRALEISEKAHGPSHPLVAVNLNNLALVYVAKGVPERAEAHFTRALAIAEKTFGPDHPQVATTLSNLAAIAYTRDDFARAEPLFARVLAIYEKALGPDHPNVVDALQCMSLLYWKSGNASKAVSFQDRAGDVRERELLANLASGSERSKLLYISQTAYEQDLAISLHSRSAPSAPEARHAAMEAVVRRKGRVLDVMSDSIAALRRRASPEDRRLLDELAEARERLSALTLEGPGAQSVEEHRAGVGVLAARVEQLEAQISTRNVEYRVQAQPVVLDDVRASIPEGARLVELASFRPYDPRTNTFEPARYVVYVAGRSGEIAWADLGDAGSVDAAVYALRAALRDPGSDIGRDVRPRARALDDLVLRPVRRLAGASRRLLVAPDGALSLVPFDALVDEAGRFAVEGYEISYLSSGRDLLRLDLRGESKAPPSVFANPDFGPRPAGASGLREIEHAEPAASLLARAFFAPLAGTASEAEALRAALPGATVRTGAEATKTALVSLDSPRILHVATHGFFLGAAPAAPASARGLQLAAAPGAHVVAPAAVIGENPLLRSGLALAGANLHRGGDGILTAYEASGLDLWGTKLVVLSACDTGVGEVRTGDGVYGLRRALVLAGSEAQVMSLWPVSDAGTRDLMVAYYTALVAGEGRSAAMRRVRLAMLADPQRRHPFFWASFIVSGAWDPIGGAKAAP